MFLALCDGLTSRELALGMMLIMKVKAQGDHLSYSVNGMRIR